MLTLLVYFFFFSKEIKTFKIQLLKNPLEDDYTCFQMARNLNAISPVLSIYRNGYIHIYNCFVFCYVYRHNASADVESGTCHYLFASFKFKSPSKLQYMEFNCCPFKLLATIEKTPFFVKHIIQAEHSTKEVLEIKTL